MNVGQLINRLEEFDPEDEVRLMFQPSWPLQFSVRGVADSADFIDLDEESSAKRIAWLVEGEHPYDAPYGYKDAWDVAYT